MSEELETTLVEHRQQSDLLSSYIHWMFSLEYLVAYLAEEFANEAKLVLP